MRLFQTQERVDDKDFVRPSGWKLFCFLVRENAWSMIEVNFITIVFCLPIVTVPAATAACTEYCLSLLEDGHHGVLRGFWSAFSKHWKAATRYGLFSLGLPVLLLFLCDAYLGSGNGAFGWQTGACLAAVAMIRMVGFYAFPMICRVDLPAGTILTNSFRLFAAKFLKCLLPLALQAVLLLLSYLLLPAGLLIVLMFGILPSVYLSVFLCYPDIREYVIDPYYRSDNAGK